MKILSHRNDELSLDMQVARSLPLHFFRRAESENKVLYYKQLVLKSSQNLRECRREIYSLQPGTYFHWTQNPEVTAAGNEHRRVRSQCLKTSHLSNSYGTNGPTTFTPSFIVAFHRQMGLRMRINEPQCA